LLDTLKPEKNIENRFMRLCNNFVDLHNLFSLGALGMMPVPDTFSPFRHERNCLSLCGVITGDLVATGLKGISGPIPTGKPGNRQGHVLWAEIETRAYLFGAIRNESDAFAEGFLAELDAHPELFAVITRSESDPAEVTRRVGNTDVDAQMRARNFSAPAAPFTNRPRGRGTWTVMRSLHDVLYGRKDAGPVHGVPSMDGYLTVLADGGAKARGWLFRFKTFPVKFFVIMDAVPNRDGRELMENVEWAALCAYGLAHGSRTISKHLKASGELMRSRATQLFSWMPASVGTWEVRTTEEQIKERGLGWMIEMMKTMNL
jgi:hypothetical protein